MKNYLIVICLVIFQSSGAQTLLGGMPVPDGDVYAIEKADSIIYIGGLFNQVNGVPHAKIAAFNATSGTLRSWSPDIGFNGVNSINRVADKLIVGGNFTSVNSQERFGICMFDLATGNLNAWTDTANYPSWKQGVAVYNNTFYYSRLLNSNGDCRVVCVDATTGNFTPWQTDSIFSGGSSINAIFASGDYVYVGGDFSLTGGTSVYDNLCRFNQSTGALDTSWHPEPSKGSFGVTAIVKTNSNIFVGGDFKIINGVSRKGVAAYDMNGNLASFNQNSSSYEVLSLFGEGNYIWVGGNSSSLGGQLRYRIAQIRISNAAATCWNASATSMNWGTVQAIYVSGDTVFTGPDGPPRLSVFTGSPVPQTGAVGITGAVNVQPSEFAIYSVPFVAGHTYNWTITGGSGSSTSNSINVTWGAGPSGTVAVVENNPSFTNCYGDTAFLQVSISLLTAVNSYNSENAFSVFPNPSNGKFILSCNKLIQNASVKILNTLGEEIYSEPMGIDIRKEIDLLALPGIYFVKVYDGEREYVQKLIVK